MSSARLLLSFLVVFSLGQSASHNKRAEVRLILSGLNPTFPGNSSDVANVTLQCRTVANRTASAELGGAQVYSCWSLQITSDCPSETISVAGAVLLVTVGSLLGVLMTVTVGLLTFLCRKQKRSEKPKRPKKSKTQGDLKTVRYEDSWEGSAPVFPSGYQKKTFK